MLLFEALEQIESRLKLKDDYKEQVPEYFEALEIAKKSIEKQMELCDVLNDFWADVKKEDRFTTLLVYDVLRQFSIDFEGYDIYGE